MVNLEKQQFKFDVIGGSIKLYNNIYFHDKKLTMYSQYVTVNFYIFWPEYGNNYAHINNLLKNLTGYCNAQQKITVYILFSQVDNIVLKIKKSNLKLSNFCA